MTYLSGGFGEIGRRCLYSVVAALLLFLRGSVIVPMIMVIMMCIVPLCISVPLVERICVVMMLMDVNVMAVFHLSDIHEPGRKSGDKGIEQSAFVGLR